MAEVMCKTTKTTTLVANSMGNHYYDEGKTPKGMWIGLIPNGKTMEFPKLVQVEYDEETGKHTIYLFQNNLKKLGIEVKNWEDDDDEDASEGVA